MSSATHIGVKSATMVQMMWNLLSAKTVVPSGFHARVNAVEKMLESDSTGLIDSLTDFMISSALTKISIETLNDDENLYAILNEWLNVINSEYRGQGIEVGLRGLMKEYFKERWKGASFPILKIANWKEVKGIMLPVSMFFVDGGSVYAEPKDKGEELSITPYTYYLGRKKEEKLAGDNVIITKPFTRWYIEYPDPYLIKRGVYQNWKILESLKNKQQQLIDQIIPYLLLITKGTEGLLHDNIKAYTDSELNATIDQIQKLQDKMGTQNSSVSGNNTPARATNADEKIEHLIPKINDMFNRDLFVEGERAILSGLGFIDVIEGATSSRKESILSPKAFLNEINNGIDDFKLIVSDLLALAVENNPSHKKYNNINTKVTSSPIKSFMSDDFKRILTTVYDRGGLSLESFSELVGEIDHTTEVYRRKSEAKNGIVMDMYPPIIRNDEGRGYDTTTIDNTVKQENNPLSKQGPDAQQYNMAKVLEQSPYNTIDDLPKNVKKYSKSAQKSFLRAWNHAFNFYKNETTAFKIAFMVLKRHLKKESLNGK